MKLLILAYLSVFSAGLASATGVESSKLVLATSRSLEADEEAAFETMELLAEGARKLLHDNETTLEPSLDKLGVLIKNVDCAACMEAPASINIRKLKTKQSKKGSAKSNKLATKESKRRSKSNDVFVSSLNCDANNPFQIWDLISLENTGTWYLFVSVATNQCMQLVGECHPDGSRYDIEMGPCENNNTRAFWGFTGIGEIVNFECFRSNYESNSLFHSTPDIFLEAHCGNKPGVDRLDLSSHSADSEDQAQNVWMLYPKEFELLATP